MEMTVRYNMGVSFFGLLFSKGPCQRLVDVESRASHSGAAARRKSHGPAHADRECGSVSAYGCGVAQTCDIPQARACASVDRPRTPGGPCDLALWRYRMSWPVPPGRWFGRRGGPADIRGADRNVEVRPSRHLKGVLFAVGARRRPSASAVWCRLRRLGPRGDP